MTKSHYGMTVATPVSLKEKAASLPLSTGMTPITLISSHTTLILTSRFSGSLQQIKKEQ
jgi:hypothetical protein